MRLLAIPAAFALGAIASRFVLHAAPAALQIDLSQPLPVVTTWSAFGALLFAILGLSIAAAGVAYCAQLRAGAPTLRDTLVTCAATLAIGLFWLPIFSSDVYAYAAYGEMARLGINPYAHVALPSDALLDAAFWQWRPSIPVCVYGEAFVGLSRLIATGTAAFGPAATLVTFRIAACIALLLCGVAIAHGTADRTFGARAAFFLCCNPIVLWATIEGHNDAIMLVLILLGIWLARAHPFLGTALVTLGALIKAPALLAGAAFAKRSSAGFAGFITGAAFVVVLSYRLIDGLAKNLAPHGHYQPLASVQSLGIFFTIALALIVLGRIRAFAEPIDRSCVLALAVWLAIANPYPWYALWIVPLGAFARDRRVVLAILAVAAVAILRYIPDAIALPGGLMTIILGLAATAAYLPLFGRDIIIRS